jgi:dTDP-4-amino-4,6-dideoxygalactose transaminase
MASPQAAVSNDLEKSNPISLESKWRVPLLDLSRTYALLEEELADAFKRILRSGRYILGPEVEALEASFSNWLGASECIGMSSGTDALLATLMALNVGPGDEVITSPLTFVSTAEVIVRLGATPVFADVCPRCHCLDPYSVSTLFGPKTRAVIAVHLFGQLGHIEDLIQLASDRAVPLVEDACQAFGSSLGGRNAGTFGIAGCFSFFPSKPLGGFGDAGLVCTNDRLLAERLRSVRSHGRTNGYQFTRLGGNFRIDALQAALIGVLVPHVRDWIEARRKLARAYTEAFRGMSCIVTPTCCSQTDSAWGAYSIRVPEVRDALATHLKSSGIETAIYYPLTLADQMLFSGRSKVPVVFGEANRTASEIISIPIFPGLSSSDQDYVVSNIREFWEESEQDLAGFS